MPSLLGIEKGRSYQETHTLLFSGHFPSNLIHLKDGTLDQVIVKSNRLVASYFKILLFLLEPSMYALLPRFLMKYIIMTHSLIFLFFN